MAIVPETEEGSGELRKGPISAGTGTDHKEIAKQNTKKVTIETAVRKRMMEDTSKITDFDRVRVGGTKRAKGVGCFGARGSKKRNGIEDASEIDDVGTGTQIVLWCTLCGCVRMDLRRS